MSVELDLELDGELPLIAPPRSVWWRAGATDTRAVDLVQARYGFVPTAWIHFRIGPGDVDGQLDELATIVAGVLAATEGDAVLHADFEQVWLVRRAGAVVLSDVAARWPSRRRAVVGAHTREPLDPRPS